MDYFRESREKTGKYNAEALLVRKYPSNLKVEVNQDLEDSLETF